jgi:hypothetical protein
MKKSQKILKVFLAILVMVVGFVPILTKPVTAKAAGSSKPNLGEIRSIKVGGVYKLASNYDVISVSDNSIVTTSKVTSSDGSFYCNVTGIATGVADITINNSGGSPFVYRIYVCPDSEFTTVVPGVSENSPNKVTIAVAKTYTSVSLYDSSYTDIPEYVTACDNLDALNYFPNIKDFSLGGFSDSTVKELPFLDVNGVTLNKCSITNLSFLKNNTNIIDIHDWNGNPFKNTDPKIISSFVDLKNVVISDSTLDNVDFAQYFVKVSYLSIRDNALDVSANSSIWTKFSNIAYVGIKKIVNGEIRGFQAPKSTLVGGKIEGNYFPYGDTEYLGSKVVQGWVIEDPTILKMDENNDLVGLSAGKTLVYFKPDPRVSDSGACFWVTVVDPAQPNLTPVQVTSENSALYGQVLATAADGVIPTDSKLVISNKTASDKAVENIKKQFGSNSTYIANLEISLVDKNGAKIQPNGKMQLKIKVPEQYKNDNNLVVVYVAEDGTVQALNTTIINGYAVFETDHFSNYALVKKASISTLPKTGENHVYPDLIVTIFGLLGAIFIMHRRVRKYRN